MDPRHAVSSGRMSRNTLMRCIFHKGSRKVDDVNSIPRPRVINREGGTEGRSPILRALRSRLKYYVSQGKPRTDMVCALILTLAGFYRSRERRWRFQFCRTSIFRVLEGHDSISSYSHRSCVTKSLSFSRARRLGELFLSVRGLLSVAEHVGLCTHSPPRPN